ncbi:hypothetical protein ShzoTeo12_11080 [Shinella zoogloeoides]|nr:hypothetical protein ShzoTeo12_11080 [Shinella zoogloeoides]
MLKAIGACVVAIIIAAGVVKAIEWYRGRPAKSKGKKK